MSTQAEGGKRRLTPEIIKQAEDMIESTFGVNPKAPVLGITDDVEIAPNFNVLMQASDTIFMLDQTDEGQIKGFDLAIPIAAMDPTRAHEADTAYLYVTVVAENMRGQGIVWGIHNKLFRELISKGYKVLETDVFTENGYADRFEREYGDLVKRLGPDHNNWGVGMERPLRLHINELPLTT